MIYWELFWGFLKVGCFSFGGAYSAIPLIRDAVLANGWMTDEQLTYMIAVSESTPGPIMVNLASYAGFTQAGFWGGLLATFAVVLPAFLIILLVATILRSALKHPAVQAVFRGLAPCIAGIITATGAYMVLEHLLPQGSPDFRALVTAGVLVGTAVLWKKCFRKALSPILLILFSAAYGAVIYSL